jgi:serine/threonine protein kinase
MNWPTHTDYQDAIQNPHICFEDVTLKSGEVGCDMLGLPKVTSGNFACVYSLTADDGRFAIRCFVRQVLGQQGRYARLAQHLMGLGLDCMVDFEYILRGIKIANEWYPILKMQWVDGLPVNQYIDEYIDDPALLKQLVNNFPPIVEQLRANNLAHCDLQHGNIMVTPENEFKLVDYDGMFTTAFRGKSPELGHANFQHPRRTPDFYNEHVDNFGALVCYLSIMAIAENPDLFKKYYAADNLLLTANDYRNPKDSEVIKTLKSQDNEKVKQLATLLEKCCLVDVLQVPDFLEVVEKLKTGEIANMVATDVSPTPAPAPAQAATGGGAAGGWWDQSTTESKPAGSAAPTTPQKTAAPATPSYLAGSTASRAPTPKTPSYANAARRPASPTPKTPPPSMRAEQPKPKAPPPPPTQIAPAGEDNNTQLLLIGAMIAGLVLLLIFMMAKAAS